MSECNLSALLNNLYSKEQALRNIRTEINEQGLPVQYGADLLKEEYDEVVPFLIFLYYKGVIHTSAYGTSEEFERLIQESNHPHCYQILALWKNLDGKYPYINDLCKILSGYDFSSFQSKEEEKELFGWVLDKYLSRCFSLIETTFNSCSLVAFDVVSNCRKQLDVNFHKGKVLVNTMNNDFLMEILKQHHTTCEYDFYACTYFTPVLSMCQVFLDRCANIRILEGDNQQVLQPNHYDAIIMDGKEDGITLRESRVLTLLKDGGVALLFGYTNKSGLEQEFLENEVPLMFDVNENNILLVRKQKDKSPVVRYGEFYVDIDGELPYEMSYWKEKLSECIKNSIFTSYYQELKKEDFIHTGGVRFKDVKRLTDQQNFVWRNKSDIFTIDEDSEEWLYNDNMSGENIITYEALSDNPFQINAGTRYSIPHLVNEKGDKTHPFGEFEFKRIGSSLYSYTYPSKYSGFIEHLYSPDRCENPKGQQIADRYLCSRVIKSPCLLYNPNGKILRVEASEEAPVCFKKFFFALDDYAFRCQPECDVIKINSHYDENFVIYQLLNQRNPSNSECLLVAPTKEEQHTYFLNKRLDYISKVQPAVDEMEDEVRKSIAESPACITGAGFTNFRRFERLSNLALGGVNIMVGGNNAGKSTFVKGLLLALDNLKHLVVEGKDLQLNNPKFQLNAHDMHDVHVGTFNRAYCDTAKVVDKNNPKRRVMEFTILCAHFEITQTLVSTDEGDVPFVPVAKVMVTDRKRNAHFVFDFENMQTSAQFVIGSENVDYHTSGLSFQNPKTGSHLLSTLIRSIASENDDTLTTLDNQAQREKIKGKSGFILEIADELERVIEHVGVEYIYAHGITQRVLFNYDDKNDYMAQTLHDLLAEKIGDVEKEFICKWLEAFGIGLKYDVHTIAGEAYTIQIWKANNRMIHLADMGMGANQLVILILRLAIIIHRQRMRGDNTYKPTVIIEEPEQNMHPAYQSKLADLFKEVNATYGFNFIIETHSEYLVRKSQVLVAELRCQNDEELLRKNPFKVYYFPTDENPYEMNYRADGNFTNEFGAGFYDVANNLLFDIL